MFVNVYVVKSTVDQSLEAEEVEYVTTKVQDTTVINV